MVNPFSVALDPPVKNCSNIDLYDKVEPKSNSYWNLNVAIGIFLSVSFISYLYYYDPSLFNIILEIAFPDLDFEIDLPGSSGTNSNPLFRRMDHSPIERPSSPTYLNRS